MLSIFDLKPTHVLIMLLEYLFIIKYLDNAGAFGSFLEICCSY